MIIESWPFSYWRSVHATRKLSGEARITLFYVQHGFDAVDLAFPGQGFVEAAIILAVGTLLGRWLARTPGFGWLFQAPWVGGGAEPQGVPSRG